jgi:uncharacterized protein DUF6894
MYYFHIRDDFGVVEDQDGIGLPDMAALVAEVVRSANEMSQEAITRRGMRFEIADASGQTVLVAPVQESLGSWDLIAQLSVTRLPMQ